MTREEKQEKLANLQYGPYLTPVIAVGAVVECEARGMVTVVGLSHAPIPWPIGERDGVRQLVVFKALARAIRQESPQAVAEAWGVTPADAEDWRSACKQPLRRKKQTITSPPIPWKREDDELIRRLTLAEAARITGRTLTAVRKRRRALGLPDGRTAAQRAVRLPDNLYSLHSHAAAAHRTLRARVDELAQSMAELRESLRRAAASLAYWRSHRPIAAPSPVTKDSERG